jgi:C-terminal processing protease CtpA/Prc
LQRAIAKVDGVRAVIFDLRDNTGGFPETVAEVAAPLFDRTVPWYNPRATQSATALSPAARSTLTTTPVYILTSSRTLSGAEQFTYNLKMLKRATVIGETTGGGGHVGAFHRLDEHFGMGIPETKITNPYGKPDWDVVGVEPDVKVKAANALDVAEKLAAKRVGR